MEILLKLIKSYAKKMGFGPLLAIILIIMATAAGIYYKYYTNYIDSPIEQAAENILDDYGINVDFSKEKKQVNK